MSKKNLSNLVNGFMKKHRTPQEIDQEYQSHAVNVGHKLEQIRNLEEQVGSHQQALARLNAEANAVNKAAQEQARKSAAKAPAPTMPQQSPAPAPQQEAGAQ